MEKLLRTPVELRYPVENKQAWTDEDFFAHYANALHEEMDAFIDGELRSAIYLEDYGKEQSDKDAAACKENRGLVTPGTTRSHRERARGRIGGT